MKEKPVDDRLPPHVKSSLWVARHYKHLLIFSLGLSALVFVLSLVLVFYMSAIVSRQARVIQNMANKVIFVRTDGSVGILEKQPYTASAIQLHLKNFVIFYLLVSGFDFDYYQDFTKSPKFQHVLDYLDEGGKSGYKAYLERVYMSYKNNNLPEYLVVSNLEQLVEDFRYQEGKFTYRITAPVDVRYVYAEKWNEGRGYVEVELRGYADASKSTVKNPLGVKFTKLEVKRYVGKGSDVNLFGN